MIGQIWFLVSLLWASRQRKGQIGLPISAVVGIIIALIVSIVVIMYLAYRFGGIRWEGFGGK